MIRLNKAIIDAAFVEFAVPEASGEGKHLMRIQFASGTSLVFDMKTEKDMNDIFDMIQQFKTEYYEVEYLSHDLVKNDGNSEPPQKVTHVDFVNKQIIPDKNNDE